MENKLIKKWMTWEEILPYKEQLIDMEIELTIKYHYPDLIIERSYFEEKVNALEQHLSNGNTFFWGVTSGDLLVGYYWAYISQFINKKRWNLRSVMFRSEWRKIGLGANVFEVALQKAKELNCDESATHYAFFNKGMAHIMEENGFNITRVEVVKDLTDK